MESIFVIIAIFTIITFIIWQFKVIMKYALKYDNIIIDGKKLFLILNKEKIFFKDIDYIELNELEQPALYEKILSKGSFGNYMSEMTLYLKNGKAKKCIFNYKGIMYKTLKQLQPYIEINTDIEKYKQEYSPNLLSIILLITSCVLIFKFLFQ